MLLGSQPQGSVEASLSLSHKYKRQAGAELCQAQLKIGLACQVYLVKKGLQSSEVFYQTIEVIPLPNN